MFIENYPQCSSENILELNWHSYEATSVSKDYYGQQHMLYYQPTQYNDRQQYQRNRTFQNVSLFNKYEIGGEIS